MTIEELHEQRAGFARDCSHFGDVFELWVGRIQVVSFADVARQGKAESLSPIEQICRIHAGIAFCLLK
jgi:hypothetical protein